MVTEEMARKQLGTLHKEGSALAGEFATEQREREKLYGKREPKDKQQVRVVIRRFGAKQEDDELEEEEEQAPEPLPPEKTRFEERYQSWYSRALPLMKQLAADRYAEFQSFYLPDPRYPWVNTDDYVIQDFFRDPDSDAAGEQTTRCFKNQLAILKSVSDRLSWSGLNTDDQAERGLQLACLDTARDLTKLSERAAGALAGAVLEAYPKKLTLKHRVKLRKQTPSLNELSKALKAAKVLDVPAWSQTTRLVEIRNRCLAKGEGPTKLQVRDLVDGTRWLLTNVC